MGLLRLLCQLPQGVKEVRIFRFLAKMSLMAPPKNIAVLLISTAKFFCEIQKSMVK